MPTPQFILDLRQQIGHDPLWLIGATGVIWRDVQDESYDMGSCPAHTGGNVLGRVASDDGGSSSGVSGCVMSDEPDREVLNDSDRAAQPGVVWAEQEERGEYVAADPAGTAGRFGSMDAGVRHRRAGGAAGSHHRAGSPGGGPGARRRRSVPGRGR
ncbi:Hydrolase [Cutibacterium granulosum DSM 20700]|uniref:Hydrolase n=2 Tax=Cutibacterium granulosum TaxID=33011 RepID=U1GGQ0_9ACTN|nr:Hydrolase [Cutibacterium granulosum DSM 20700]ERF66433.1 Hydrolase [Cutibacterium granulosum TM11]